MIRFRTLLGFLAVGMFASSWGCSEEGDGDGSITTSPLDADDDDGDGFSEEEGDCDDANPKMFPGGSEGEMCDTLDNDCDYYVDEGLGSTFYYDHDDDNWGDDNISITTCYEPLPYFALVGGDCDDNNGYINPAAVEIYDFVDDDCDGLIDEGF